METQSIKSARLFNRNGRDLVCFNGNIVVSAKQVADATGLKAQYQILVGGNISVDFYKADEKMRNDVVCTKDNMIVKEFTIELPSELLAYQRAAAFGANLIAA